MWTAAAAKHKRRSCLSTFLCHFYKDTSSTRRVQHNENPRWQLPVSEQLAFLNFILFYSSTLMIFLNNLRHVVDTELFMPNFRTSPYHYVPSQSTAITFIVLFGLSTGKKFTFLHSVRQPFFVLNLSRPPLVIHLGYATFYRMWWLFPTIGLCGVLEIVGWSGRLWSSFSPLLGKPFKIQSVFPFIF